MKNPQIIQADRFTAAVILVLMFFVVLMTSSCGEEEKMEPSKPETSTTVDVDGNIYVTVKIGDQWWMAENLKVTRFRNGDPISSVTDAQQWADIQSPAYCLFEGNSAAPGLLYNGYAVSASQQLAPQGWRIPTDDDWKKLERHLGMSDVDVSSWRGTIQGDQLKDLGTASWTSFSDVWATNESGFTAKAGGCRMPTGAWGTPGLFATGFWWSSTEKQDGKLWYRHLDYKRSDVFRQYGSSNYGFSIRCVKE
ncbi:MAG: fibrobacter succinogenes major paralogous domain-containing protein [Bacteroidota bacterium]